MSTATKLLLAIVVAGGMMFCVTACTAISFNNDCVTQEQAIKAQHKKNQVVYDTMWKKVSETANVAEAHADKLKEIAVETIQGRYRDKDGNQSNGQLFTAIAEANGQQLPPDLYKKVQQIIEASRSAFEANQTSLISKRQAYETSLQRFPGTIYAGLLGFPKIDLDEYGVVTSSKTKDTFATGEENVAMTPFGKK